MLFFGNLLKESGVTRRLANTASGPLIDTITILLGLTVGASTQASEFLTLDSILIFGLGALSFTICHCIRRNLCEDIQYFPEERQQDQSTDW